MTTFLKNAFSLVKKNALSVLVFEVLFRPAYSIALTAILNYLLQELLGRMNYSYLTAENYIQFLSSPLSILVILLILLLLALIKAVEISALFRAVQYAREDRKISSLSMLLQGGRDAISFIRQNPVLWFFYILLTLPFLELHFIVWEITQNKILEYTFLLLMKSLPASWMIGPICAVLVLLSLLVTLTLPYTLLERQKIWRSLRKHQLVLKNRRVKCVISIVIMEILILLFTIVFLLVISILLVADVSLFVKASNRVNAVLTYANSMKSFTALICGTSGMVLAVFGLTTAYIPSRDIDEKEPIVYVKRYLPWLFGRRWINISLSVILLILELGSFFVINYRNTGAAAAVNSEFKVVAHRGGALYAPENTLSAIEQSIECLSDMAEIDVQETKDDQLILLHDNSLKRTTGMNAKVWEMTYPEILKLDAGIKFSQKFLGERVPTLAETIEVSKGRILLNIEVKNNDHNKNIVSRVVQCIEDEDFVDQCVITSMDFSFLKKVKELNPNIRTGYIMTMTYGRVSQIKDVDFFSVRYNYVNKSFVEEAHQSGKEVYAWTVNYPGDVQRMLNYGVDGIITDDPALVRGIYLGEDELMSGFMDLLQYVLRG